MWRTESSTLTPVARASRGGPRVYPFTVDLRHLDRCGGTLRDSRLLLEKTPHDWELRLAVDMTTAACSHEGRPHSSPHSHLLTASAAPWEHT